MSSANKLNFSQCTSPFANSLVSNSIFTTQPVVTRGHSTSAHSIGNVQLQSTDRGGGNINVNVNGKLPSKAPSFAQ